MIKNAIWLIIAVFGLACYFHPALYYDVSAALTGSPIVASLLRNSALEPDPNVSVKTGSGVVLITSKDDRDLKIEKVIVNNQEIATGWEPHEEQQYNPQYVQPPQPPYANSPNYTMDVHYQSPTIQCQLRGQPVECSPMMVLQYQQGRERELQRVQDLRDRDRAAYDQAKAKWDALPDSAKTPKITVTTPDQRLMTIGDQREISVAQQIGYSKKIVKVEIVTNHGTWIGGNQ
jgi:hypothetical protein